MEITPNEIIKHIEAITTPENEKIMIAAIKAIKYKAFFDSLCNKGLMIANWHLNGDLEPLDSFIESATQEGRGVEKHLQEDVYSPLGNKRNFANITNKEYTVDFTSAPPTIFSVDPAESSDLLIIRACKLYQLFAGFICRSSSVVFRVLIKFIKTDVLEDTKKTSANLLYFNDCIKPLIEIINRRSVIFVFDTQTTVQNEDTYIDFCIVRKTEDLLEREIT